MPDTRDAEAIQAVLRGEVDRYAELVDRHQTRALYVALGLLGNLDDARDAVQEAFVSAYRNLARFRGRAVFSTWLYRIVVNRCRDVQRQRSRHPAAARIGTAEEAAGNAADWFEPVDAAGGPDAAAAEQELSRRLSAAVRDLPEQQRLAFLLHRLEGLSIEETATAMGCRAGTVKSHVFRAMAALRQRLEPWLKEERIHGRHILAE